MDKGYIDAEELVEVHDNQYDEDILEQETMEFLTTEKGWLTFSQSEESSADYSSKEIEEEVKEAYFRGLSSIK